MTWSPDDPLTIAAAGSLGKMQVWDVGSNNSVRKTFSDRLPQREWREKENGGVVGLVNDAGDDTDDGEE